MSKQSNPWTTKSKQVVYDNNWIHVEEHQVLNPSGKPGIYGVVQFKNLAIGVIPVDTEGNTWLVGQHRYPLDMFTWEIPEGGGPINKDPIDTAHRELLEETGIVASKMELILKLQTSNSCTDEIAFIYLATGLTFYEANPDENEQITVKKVSLDEAYRMIDTGEIQDAMSVAGLLKLRCR